MKNQIKLFGGAVIGYWNKYLGLYWYYIVFSEDSGKIHHFGITSLFENGNIPSIQTIANLIIYILERNPEWRLEVLK